MPVVGGERPEGVLRESRGRGAPGEEIGGVHHPEIDDVVLETHRVADLVKVRPEIRRGRRPETLADQRAPERLRRDPARPDPDALPRYGGRSDRAVVEPQPSIRAPEP